MLSIEGNPNYAAVLTRYDSKNEVPLEGRDRVIGYQVLGYQTIIPKGLYQDGDTVVVFGAETQVSEDYARENNLYRHEHLNEDPTQKGYLEDNRRIKAIRLGGHRSDAMLMSASSLDYLQDGTPLAQWELELLAGTSFDTYNGIEVCRKYQRPVKASGQSMSGKQGQKKVRVSTEHFPEHFDTPNGFRTPDSIQPDEFVTVTQKLHGTSVRLANVPVERDLKWYERLAQKVGIPVVTHEHGIVVGSRRTTKSINEEVESGKEHFYANDIWTEATRGMGDTLPQNFVVFAEIVGWTPEGSPIQKDYTYGVGEELSRVYVYRVAIVNDAGDMVDLPWRAVERFCQARDWLVTPMLWAGFYREFQEELERGMWTDVRFFDHPEDPEPDAIPLSHKSLPDEGVVVRAETGFQPTVLKFKSPAFLRHESVLMDEDVADVEAEEV